MSCKGINKCCNTNIYSFDEAGNPPLPPIPPIVPGPPSPPPNYPLPPGPGAPPPPTIVNAVLQNDNTITVSWNTAAGALAYNLYRATVSGGPYTLVQAAINALSYNDTTVLAGTTYFYVVQSENATESGIYSMEASATTNPSYFELKFLIGGATANLTIIYYDQNLTQQTVTAPSAGTILNCYKEPSGLLPSLSLTQNWVGSAVSSDDCLMSITSRIGSTIFQPSTDSRSLLQAKMVVSMGAGGVAQSTSKITQSLTSYTADTGSQTTGGTYTNNGTFPTITILNGASISLEMKGTLGLSSVGTFTNTIKLAIN